jgi:tripartite-type tricarboxylate transporter receptor subunit TctC
MHMFRARSLMAVWLSIFVLTSIPTRSSAADTAADFYKGKTVTLISGSAAGGGYDLYVRLLADALRKHIPGSPALIVQNRVGAGGLAALEYVYNVAPKDGTYIIMPFNVDPMYAVLQPDRVRFDLSKLVWLGNMAELSNVLAVTKEAGVASIEDVRAREVIMAGSGDGSQTSMIPMLFNKLSGTRFRVVSGYKGTASMMLSMQRGETQGRVGSWYSFSVSHPDLAREGRLVILAQDGLRRHTDLPGVHLYEELMSDPKARAIMRFVSYPVATSRALALAPGAPPDRIAALRAAFIAAMKDPDLLATAAKRKMEIHPSGHAEVERTLAELYSTPPDIVAEIRAIMAPPKR